ncbi:MAG: transposase [Candidatus Buchananbacteria bacterium]|nr:transposase [Candidatus Buchananbacteria bacterium]
MAKTIKEERLRWVLPIVNQKIRLVDAVKVCPYGKRSLERWVSQYKQFGEDGLEPKSTRPRSQLNETLVRIKERIIELRNETKLCAKKLSWQLKKEGINLHPRTIGKIIKTEGLVRRYKVRKLRYKYIKVPLSKGELVEIDIKYVPQTMENRQYYQFTAIDCASRWRYLSIYEHMGSSEAMAFLKEVIKVAPFRIRAIKTDNGSCFTNRYIGYSKSIDPINPKIHAFDLECQKHNIIHYLIDPGKPAQNGKVERSHRSDQETFYDQVDFSAVEELKYKLKLWNMYYNDLEHCGLNGKTPNQMLEILTN